MHADAGSNGRLKELVAKIETEEDPQKFTELMLELYRLIDGDPPLQQPSSPNV